MNEEWLIDGYNLLHFIAARKKTGSAIPSTKTALCSALAGFAACRRHRVCIVFDGSGSPDELKVHETRFFSAVYSLKVTADTHIEKYIFDNKASLRLTVVTDDRTVSNLVRGGGGRVLKNSEFLEMLMETGHEKDKALHDEKVRSHGFNRPFDEKLKTKGL